MKKRPRPAPISMLLCLAACLSVAACDDRGSAATGLPAPSNTGRADAGTAKPDAGTPPSGSNPQLQCRNLLLALCAKDTSCGSPALTAAECLAQFTMTDCSRVTAVSDTYETCLREIPASACPLSNVPQSCVGVLIN